MNQNRPIKTKAYRTGRQPSDFRINRTKTNSKLRGKTANGPRNPVKATFPNGTDLKSQKPISKHNSGTKDAPKTSKQSTFEKRAQSQHNERKKNKIAESQENSTDMFAELESFKDQIRSNNYTTDNNEESKVGPQTNPESQDFLDTDITTPKDVASIIKLAEAKIKATADAMSETRKAYLELEEKITGLKNKKPASKKVHKEVPKVEKEIKSAPVKQVEEIIDQPPTRQERVANMVDELVAKSTDFSTEMADQNCEPIQQMSNKDLEPIKEQFTEEIQGALTEEAYDNTYDEGPNMQFDVEQIFNSNSKPNTSSQARKEIIQDTPMFGEKEEETARDPFANFLCLTDLSAQKIADRKFVSNPAHSDQSHGEITKNILSEFEQQYNFKDKEAIQAKMKQ